MKMTTTPARLLIVCLVASLLSASRASGQVLRIYNIDVEQADAALLVMPNGKTLLIDSGKNGHGQRVKDVMDRAGVSTIDPSWGRPASEPDQQREVARLIKRIGGDGVHIVGPIR